MEFLSGPGDPRYVIALTTTTQARTRVRLVSQGTAPSDLGDQFRLGTPQLVAISGTEGVPNSATPDAPTLRDFTITRVASCTMPNTATVDEPAWPRDAGAALLVTILTAAALVGLRRIRSASR